MNVRSWFAISVRGNVLCVSSSYILLLLIPFVLAFVMFIFFSHSAIMSKLHSFYDQLFYKKKIPDFIRPSMD